MQVHRYLNEYAAAGAALPLKLLARNNALFASALAASNGSLEEEARCGLEASIACEKLSL